MNCNISLCSLQSFGGRPSVFVSAKYARSTKPDDATYVWLENVNSGSFEVCIREFLPFDGKHQDTIAVRKVFSVFYWDSKSPLAFKICFLQPLYVQALFFFCCQNTTKYILKAELFLNRNISWFLCSSNGLIHLICTKVLHISLT